MKNKNLNEFIYKWFIPALLIDLIAHIIAYFFDKSFFSERNEILYFLIIFIVLLVFRIIFHALKYLIQAFIKETIKGKIFILIILITLILMRLEGILEIFSK